MKIVIIGAGSAAFTPALLSGFSQGRRYEGATLGLVDVDEAALALAAAVASRISEELDLGWTVEASTQRRDVLPGADLVTTAIGVGGLEAWIKDVEIPRRYGLLQPVGDTTGPGGLARALRHVPVLVEVAQDMERLCPNAAFYNFANPLTVNTQAVNRETRVRCVGLCVGVDLTWGHLCRVLGVEKSRTSITAAGLNHCHWVWDFRIDGEDGLPRLRAALEEREDEPLCSALFRAFGAYPGPGDGHVMEFFPQLVPSLRDQLGDFHGGAIAHVKQSYPVLNEKLRAIAERREGIDVESFARELAWEHTQLLDLLVSQQDDLGQVFTVNVPNRGYLSNLPDGVVVEVPARVDREGIHPLALGDLPGPVVPPLAHKAASLDLIIDAALEGSRVKAVQAFQNDPHCADLALAERLVNEIIDEELAYLPRFQ